MQQNSSETSSKACRCPQNEQKQQQQSSRGSAPFPRLAQNPSFVVTPESTGMKLRSDNSRKKPQQEPPLVDVKSYYERHNKSVVKIQADYKPESTFSFHSSHSNTPVNSGISIRAEDISPEESYNPTSNTEFKRQNSSPNISPSLPSQQWSYAQTSNENSQPNSSYLSNTHSSSFELSDAFGRLSAIPTPEDNSHIQNVTSSSEIPSMSCCDQQMLSSRPRFEMCMDNSAHLNLKHLNDVYASRIQDTDVNAYGDKDLKICIYKEWIEMLIKINEAFITNMEELEREVAERLELMQKRVNSNCRNSQGNELMKCRKDIASLLKYIAYARKHDKWDLQGLEFETITPSQVFDRGELEGHEDNIKDYNDTDNLEKNKLQSNMKALAQEVAEKHDEVRELKRQVVSLEDEIQKAQKKIQLKDDVVKELRNDLKTANNKLSSNNSLDPSVAMAPINYENQTSRSANTQITGHTSPFPADNGSQFDSLSHTEREEQQKIKDLEKEITDFFEINKGLNKQQMENQRKRIMDIIEKLDSEKAAAYRKLDFIRRQLTNLETDSIEGNTDSDSGFHSKSENDQDAKILEAVRKRLRKLNDMNCDLKKRMQKLEMEKNEIANNLQSEKKFAERNSEVLRQIADLLCGMIGKQFSYTDIYNASSNQTNPFCEAIADMQKDYQNKENQLLKALGSRNKQNEHLSQMLIKNERDFNEERELRMSLPNFEDIDNNITTLVTTSSPSLPATISISTVVPPPQAPSTMSALVTGQNLDNTTATASLK